MKARALGLALLAALALAACDKAVNAGNASAADSPDTTGASMFDPGGRSRPAQPGLGAAGGLGGSSGLGLTGSFPERGASSGR
jgi:hypothetical protein